MKKLSALLILLALFLGGPPPPVQAQLMVTELHGFNVGGVPPVTLLGSQSDSSGAWASGSTDEADYTPPAGTEFLLIITNWRVGGSAGNCSSAFWNGVAATEITDHQSNNRAGTCAYAVYNPPAASQKFNITYSTSVNGSTITFLAFSGAGSGITAAASTSAPTTGQDCIINPDPVRVGSYFVANHNQANAAVLGGNNFTATGTGWSELYDVGGSDSNDHHFVVAINPTYVGANTLTTTTSAASDAHTCTSWEIYNQELGKSSYAWTTPAVSFQQCSTASTNFTGTNPYTYASVNVGTAASDRTTVVVVGAEDGASSYTISSMTIGGDSATELADAGGAQTASTGVYAMSNPSGTSEDIVITWSEAITSNQIYVCVWSVTGLVAPTAAYTALNANRGSNSNTLSMNSNVPDHGVVIAGCYNNSTTSTATWTGPTERADAATTSGAINAADYAATTKEDTKTISSAMTGTNPASCSSVVMR